MTDDRKPEPGSAEVAKRMAVLRRHLHDAVPLGEAATDAGISLRTARRWLARYRADGPAGLARPARPEAGKRTFPKDLVELVEGMALLKPPPSIVNIHRRLAGIVGERDWRMPSYGSVRDIVRRIDPAMLTLTHEGAAAFRDKFELVHRHRAECPNAIWQADHTQLDILILDAGGHAVRPWLTTVLDDHSRVIAGYMIFLGAPSALNTSLALRQAIWRKVDPAWPVCGIPDVLYVDHGSDFTSLHLEQAAADLRIRLIYSAVARPQGRGKIERLFRTINTELLAELPGNLRNGKPVSTPRLTLPELDAAIGTYIVATYNVRPHSAIGVPPVDAWRGDGWLSRMPETLEELDALLVMVAKPRIVHRDGIRFEGLRYFNPTSAAFRHGLDARGLRWAVGIVKNQKVYEAGVQIVSPTGRARKSVPDREPRDAETMLAELAWRQVAWRHGTKGKLAARFAMCRVRVGDGPTWGNNRHLPGAEVWLVGEWRSSGERKYYLSNLPAGTTRRALAGAIKARWVCEHPP